MSLTRRGLTVALAGLTLPPVAVWAQDAGDLSAPPDEPPPLDAAALDLLPNLTTRMAVPVRIAGQGPFQFVIDTGAGRTALSRELAESLGLAAGPNVTVHGVVSAETTPTVIAPRLDFAFSRLEALILPVFPRARLGVDGLLGVDVLGDYRLTFDMAGARVSLVRSPRQAYVQRMENNASRLGRSQVMRGRQRFGQLTVVDVRADDVPVTAFIDSGAQFSVGNTALYRSIAVRRPGIRDRVWRTPILGVTGQSLQGDLAILSDLRLGGAGVRNMPMLFADLHAFDVWGLSDTPALLMGADILGRFRRVTLDFGRAELIFGPRLGRRE